MIKVFISPDYYGTDPHKDNGGIKRVCEAQIKHLPTFGIEVVHNPDKAHIIMNHAGMKTSVPGVPSVNVNHGLMWSRQPWGDGMADINCALVDSMKMAVAWTAPSNWVANAIRRGAFFYPETVWHGVDAQDFAPADKAEDFVLWNKARHDFVSDSGDMQKVASLMQKTNFISTIGIETSNVKLAGVIPYKDMKKLVSKAGVYLSTARETFGIGTLEAMASGVPVAGFNWGGNSEIIKQGVTGYLAEPGNFKALAECITMCQAERERLSKNCIQDVAENWTWEPRIEQYADIFKRVYNEFYENNRPKVTILVTAYKLDRFLPTCLESVMHQTYSDFECIVVDDALLESTRKLVEHYAGIDKRIRYVRPKHNLGLVGARNFGMSKANGRYIRHVDGDDWLADNALALEVNALDKDPLTHIVYGHLEVVNEDGSRNKSKSGEPIRSGWPGKEFDWLQQMAHMNQLPSCSMARREVYERSGGYRERMKRNEDAEFWCRVTSLGFNARKVTEAVTYFHRNVETSKGAMEWKKEGGEPDWTGWFPWRIGTTNYKDATRKLTANDGEHPSVHLVPFGAQGRPKQRRFWHVHDYAYPVVSIIVTCGPGHEKYLLDALDSIQAQSYPDWECIVVNDTGIEWDKNIMGAPWAKVINNAKNMGASFARNAGLPYISHSSRYVAWLDADDYWLPWYLDRMVSYAELNDGVIYSDMIRDDGTKLDEYKYDEFDPVKVVRSMCYPGSSILYPRKAINAMWDFQKCWDLKIPGMEDWDFQMAVHHLGFCGYHVPEALFVYRMISSTKREADYAKIKDIVAYMDKKWAAYRKEGKEMACGCGAKKKSVSKPASTLSSSGNFTGLTDATPVDGEDTQMVLVQYVGPIAETFSIRSIVDRGIQYRFGNNTSHSTRTVFRGDLDRLLSFTDRIGNPTYRIIQDDKTLGNNDPSAFLGKPIEEILERT